MALDLTVGTTKTTPAPDPQISYDDPFAVLVPPAPALTNAHHLVNVLPLRMCRDDFRLSVIQRS